MDRNEFIIFKRCIELEEVTNSKNFLVRNGIEALVKEIENPLDAVILGDILSPKYELLIQRKDLDQAEKILYAETEKEIKFIEVESDYYLLDYNNDELIDMLIVPHEWSEFDLVLARKILNQRKFQIDENEISLRRKEKLELLAQPDKANPFWIYLGYVFAVTGGFFGLLIGSVYLVSKKSLPNGTKVYTYSETIRKHARIILIISIIVFPIVLIYKVWGKILLYSNY